MDFEENEKDKSPTKNPYLETLNPYLKADEDNTLAGGFDDNEEAKDRPKKIQNKLV